jgi:Tat protein translocase TatB subunit
LPLLALPHYDGSVSFSETIFLFVLALIVFGPKKLPEIARQAGKLLAELRRASNEFRSQIDAEIAHLEVQKSAEKYQTVLPPTQPPPGAVASLSQNPSQPITHQLDAATLAAPAPESSAAAASVDAAPASASSTSSASAEPVPAASAETVPANDLTSAPASQDSHV